MPGSHPALQVIGSQPALLAQRAPRPLRSEETRPAILFWTAYPISCRTLRIANRLPGSGMETQDHLPWAVAGSWHHAVEVGAGKIAAADLIAEGLARRETAARAVIRGNRDRRVRKPGCGRGREDPGSLHHGEQFLFVRFGY